MSKADEDRQRREHEMANPVEGKGGSSSWPGQSGVLTEEQEVIQSDRISGTCPSTESSSASDPSSLIAPPVIACRPLRPTDAELALSASPSPPPTGTTTPVGSPSLPPTSVLGTVAVSDSAMTTIAEAALETFRNAPPTGTTTPVASPTLPPKAVLPSEVVTEDVQPTSTDSPRDMPPNLPPSISEASTTILCNVPQQSVTSPSPIAEPSSPVPPSSLPGIVEKTSTPDQPANYPKYPAPPLGLRRYNDRPPMIVDTTQISDLLGNTKLDDEHAPDDRDVPSAISAHGTGVSALPTPDQPTVGHVAGPTSELEGGLAMTQTSREQSIPPPQPMQHAAQSMPRPQEDMQLEAAMANLSLGGAVDPDLSVCFERLGVADGDADKEVEADEGRVVDTDDSMGVEADKAADMVATEHVVGDADTGIDVDVDADTGMEADVDVDTGIEVDVDVDADTMIEVGDGIVDFIAEGQQTQIDVDGHQNTNVDPQLVNFFAAVALHHNDGTARPVGGAEANVAAILASMSHQTENGVARPAKNAEAHAATALVGMSQNTNEGSRQSSKAETASTRATEQQAVGPQAFVFGPSTTDSGKGRQAAASVAQPAFFSGSNAAGASQRPFTFGSAPQVTPAVPSVVPTAPFTFRAGQQTVVRSTVPPRVPLGQLRARHASPPPLSRVAPRSAPTTGSGPRNIRGASRFGSGTTTAGASTVTFPLPQKTPDGDVKLPVNSAAQSQPSPQATMPTGQHGQSAHAATGEHLAVPPMAGQFHDADTSRDLKSDQDMLNELTELSDLADAADPSQDPPSATSNVASTANAGGSADGPSNLLSPHAGQPVPPPGPGQHRAPQALQTDVECSAFGRSRRRAFPPRQEFGDYRGNQGTSNGAQLDGMTGQVGSKGEGHGGPEAVGQTTSDGPPPVTDTQPSSADDAPVLSTPSTTAAADGYQPSSGSQAGVSNDGISIAPATFPLGGFMPPPQLPPTDDLTAIDAELLAKWHAWYSCEADCGIGLLLASDDTIELDFDLTTEQGQDQADFRKFQRAHVQYYTALLQRLSPAEIALIPDDIREQALYVVNMDASLFRSLQAEDHGAKPLPHGPAAEVVGGELDDADADGEWEYEED